MFLYDKSSHFNIANIVTFLNITAGIIAIYLIQEANFFWAAVLAWIGGAFDIIDGKLARKYKLSTEFGIQLDSFADFVSFVIMPSFFLFYALKNQGDLNIFFGGVVFIFYIISGLRRLIEFNINADEGKVEKYFTGVPTPLGAILLWVLYLLYSYGVIYSEVLILLFVVIIATLLNSKVKIPHL